MGDSDFGWTRLDKEDDTHVSTKEKSRYIYDGMLDTETVTNPTDKTVAHLLKHPKETKESCEGNVRESLFGMAILNWNLIFQNNENKTT
ncbi:hypothetical protein YC2023_042617 [Brassica napus]